MINMQVCSKCREYVEELQEEIRQLKESAGDANFLPHPAWKLSPTETIIFQLFISRKLVTRTMCHVAIDKDCWDEIENPKTFDVFICKMRKKLGPFGIAIDNHYMRGRSLVQGQRELIQKACEGGDPYIGPPIPRPGSSYKAKKK